METPTYVLEFEKPLRELTKQLDELRQQSIASSKLPTTAKQSAVARAGKKSTARQHLAATPSSASLTGCPAFLRR